METEKQTNEYNYYEVLEVEENAPQHEVHKAYVRAKETYSSENPALYTVFSPTEAKQLLLLVEEAYSVLGNTRLRNAYHQKIGIPLLKSEQSSDNQGQQRVLPAVNLDLRQKAPLKLEYAQNEKMESEIRACEKCDGAFLQKVRSYKGLTVAALSEIIKVSSFYINAVEEMNPVNLPAPVFVRGYVSQISKTLGLPEKKAIDSYMAIFKEKCAARGE